MATGKKSNDGMRNGNSGGNKPADNSRRAEGRDRAEAEAPALTYRHLDPAAMAALFGSAVGLYRARPWRWVPAEETLFSVTSKQLGLEEAALFLMGQEGGGSGFLLFSSGDDFEAYLDSLDKLERGEEVTAPRHIALSFEQRSELEPALRKEIQAKGWEVRASDGVPVLVGVDPQLVVHPPSTQDVATAEAIVLALPEFLRNPAEFTAAWKEDKQIERTLTVRSHAGATVLTLRSPFDSSAGQEQGDLLDELQALEADEALDNDARMELEDELISLFLESPEARDLDEAHYYRPIFDLAVNHHSATIATLQPSELSEVLFELLPSKMSVKVTEANAIIAECRALVEYLKREFGWEQADECLSLLGADAVTKLEAALARN